MALFKILKGKSANLPSNKVNGYCYVTIDEHKLYVDYTKDDGTLDRFALNAVSADQWKTARNLNGMVVNGTSNVVNYGTCSTAAATAAKVVSCSNFALITGAEITVKFTTTNTAANPTLNVNSTGAKAIYYRGSAISAGYLAANRTYTFRYNGSQYDLVGDLDTNTTYSAGDGLTLSGTQFNHKNSVSAGTASGDANKTLTFGSTFTIPTITYDAQGHITGKGTTTMTMPANPNTDTHYTTGITAGETGTTSNSATTNGNTFIKIKDNSTHRGQIKIVGSGATTVTSDANGVITINSTDNNTTYGSMSIDEGTTGTATTNRVLTATNLKGIINAHAPTKTGNGASGTWGISISGNAATATKLATARTISLTGSVTGSGSFDGSGNLNIATTTNHTHSYLPLSGGTLSGDINFSNSNGSITWNSATWHQRIKTTDDATSDTAVFTFQQSSDSGSSFTDLMVIRDNGKVLANTFVGALSGNASTASKLATARTISLTGSVTGSGTFDGSGNLNIATTTNHSHNYAGSSSAGGSATSAVKLDTATAGSTTQPVYFSGGKPVAITGTIANSTSGNAATATKATKDGNGNVISSTYLPLSAGQNKKLTGPLGLTENVNYGKTLPQNGFDGQLFFLEDENIDNPSLPTGGTAGQVLVKNSSIDGDASWATDIAGNAATVGQKNNPNTAQDANSLILDEQSKSTFYSFNTDKLTNRPSGSSLGYLTIGSYSGSYNYQTFVDGSNGATWNRTLSGTTWSAWKKFWQQGDAVTGAVWNDYAECRESDCEDFGYVLMETGDDSLTKTIERLSHFAGVSSDTWGFSQGETAKAHTPIAVAGRVLVYPYQDRNNYKPGDCVCAAPGGTVDIMTREEVREWPDRIVGTVSCVPEYEEWGGGEGADRDPVKVNGRIWIKVV